MEEEVQDKQSSKQSPTPISDNAAAAHNAKGIGIILMIVIFALILGGSYFLLSHKSPTQQAMQNSPASSQPTPAISPVTAGTVDQTLNTTDTKIQESIDQANTDLNSINSIDKSQDSTNGL